MELCYLKAEKLVKMKRHLHVGTGGASSIKNIQCTFKTNRFITPGEF